MREILKLILVLTLICGVSASTLQFARTQLEDRIEQQNDRYIRGPALSRLFNAPADQVLQNKIMLTIDRQEYPVFYTEEGDQVTGLAIEAPGKGGYGGDIRIMIGINLKTRELLGMEIIQHSETPGVGSQIEKASFREQWQRIPSDQEIALRQNNGTIQGITGATYSSRAVVNGTNTIIGLVINHSDEIKQLIKKVGSNHRVIDKKVQMDVVPPFSLVAAYRRGRWSSAEGELVCGGCNKKDNLPNQQSLPADRLVVLSYRDGEITSRSSVICPALRTN